MKRNPSVEQGGKEEKPMQTNASVKDRARPASWNPSIKGEETLLHIPAGVNSLEGFRRWTSSKSFPERGRIDFLEGELEIDLSGENLYRHGAPKTAIAAALYDQLVRTGRGSVYVDSTRIASVHADISVEPDVVAVLWDSLEAGRVRQVPAASGEEDSYIELEGSPDLVVEIVSQSSVSKDRWRLPPLYAKAGIPELWLVDARGGRGSHLKFWINLLGPVGYDLAPVEAGGWRASRILGRRCRLRRHAVRDLGFTFELELR
jgi:Uma2 family endonuclease